MAKYIIENRYITPFFSENFKYVPEKKNETKFFERDKTYLLTGLDCDGFSMPTKRYKYVGSIDEVDGYTAVQNGINDWTVSGNGHSFHVTATSVTGK